MEENYQSTPPAIEQPAETKIFDTIWFRLAVIVVITLLLLIPKEMISALNKERQDTAISAQDEITSKWAQPQHITGPILAIPCVKGKNTSTLYVLPKSLNVNANVNSQTLHRSIYEAVVYNTGIDMNGTFDLHSQLALRDDSVKVQLDKACVILGVTDLRGISKRMMLSLNNKNYDIRDGGMNTDIQSRYENLSLEGLAASDEVLATTRGVEAVVSTPVDVTALAQTDSVPYNLHLDIKGSEMLSFAPVGENTQICIKGDCTTPSFLGFILPSDRKVDNNGFEATWNMIGINRAYPQSFSDNQASAISNSHVAVSLKVPVENSQKTERALKYGLLVIVLTFVAAFFTELKTHKRIGILQYVLIGLALVLFYSLLLSIGEHTAFAVAYLIATVMTVTMVTLYVIGVLKARKQGLMIGALLALMYVYIFVLLNLETWALVAGSVGLFIILAAIMYYSLNLRPSELK